jgi:hypothetical protein
VHHNCGTIGVEYVLKDDPGVTVELDLRTAAAILSDDEIRHISEVFAAR